MTGCQSTKRHAAAVAGMSSWLPLDYGFRFYGYDLTFAKVEPGVRNKYFDPLKPTVVITHGFTRNKYKTKNKVDKNGQPLQAHEFFNYPDPGNADANVNVIDAWLDKGFNVAFFDWTPFSDEWAVTPVEEKIWRTDQNGEVRWRTSDSGLTTRNSPNLPIADLFVRDYKVAMQGYQGSNVRFVAMSLGGQLITRAARMLKDAAERHEIPANLVPARLAILDPYAGNKPLLGTWRGAQMREQILQLKREGLIFELTKTSDFLMNGLIGDLNHELVAAIGRLEFNLGFFPDKGRFTQIVRQHIASEYLYLRSMSLPVPTACIGGTCRTLTSAAASDAQARAFMEAAAVYTQDHPMLQMTAEFGNFAPTASSQLDHSPTTIEAAAANITADPDEVDAAEAASDGNGTVDDRTADTPDQQRPAAGDGSDPGGDAAGDGSRTPSGADHGR